MKKGILLSICSVVIAIVLTVLIFKKERCVPLQLKRLKFNGNAQILIGQPNDKAKILLANLIFGNSDSVRNDIISLNGVILASGFNYGNFINDSLMLVFNSNYKPFIFNTNNNKTLPYKSSLTFVGKDFNDIQIVKFKGEMGIALTEKNSILFENIKTGGLSKIFDSKQLKIDDISLVSFDILNDKIITCLKREPENVEKDNYDFYYTDSTTNQKIFSLTDIKIKKDVPKVKFINTEKYLITYFNKKSFIRINNINSSSTGYWCTDGEILNTLYVNKVLYITLRRGTVEQSLLKNNLYKVLYSGINVYQVINSIK